ncbi:unnamed protein product [Rangifer tarandus platyrhynchus]|uniref:Uncharacterized protein n=2 Tax=Rangifer tarandus platyrhynchus TaxID=3082113 RepID=A0ACB0E2M1_RANTA|nr:unnamed protein product [Rangifer tarandus platyrhynchus]CAI9694853.1 unnamed protein product [Rangifer tarandus platyrhynchus]
MGSRRLSPPTQSAPSGNLAQVSYRYCGSSFDHQEPRTECGGLNSKPFPAAGPEGGQWEAMRALGCPLPSVLVPSARTPAWPRLAQWSRPAEDSGGCRQPGPLRSYSIRGHGAEGKDRLDPRSSRCSSGWFATHSEAQVPHQRNP